MFLADLGIEKSGLDRLIQCSYDLLGLISFLTYGKDECRAWTIKKGTKAPQAAGKIHSDIERGFIRAETINFDEMMACGGGARSAFWRQMLADVYGCPIQTAKAALEGPALGVAILAGVGTGVYPSVESACDAIVKPDTVLYPDVERSRAYEPYYRLYLRQYPALRETFHALAAMRSRA